MAIQIPNAGTGNGQTGDNEYVLWQKTINNFSDQTNAASRLVGTAKGNLLEVGVNGLAGASAQLAAGDTLKDVTNGFFRLGSNYPIGQDDGYGSYGVVVRAGGSGTALLMPYSGQQNEFIFRTFDYTGIVSYKDYKVWTDRNTTVDGSGFIKRASPIVNLHSDHIELNWDAEHQGLNITFEKLGKGDYLVKGTLGFAQEGWYIENPKDANGNVLVAVVYEQLANNDISVKTYAKKFDEETGDIVPNLLRPLEIKEGRFISIRLHELPKEPPVMPDDTQMEEVELNKE